MSTHNIAILKETFLDGQKPEKTITFTAENKHTARKKLKEQFAEIIETPGVSVIDVSVADRASVVFNNNKQIVLTITNLKDIAAQIAPKS